jgi:hypothetical protein
VQYKEERRGGVSVIWLITLLAVVCKHPSFSFRVGTAIFGGRSRVFLFVVEILQLNHDWATFYLGPLLGESDPDFKKVSIVTTTHIK